MLLLLISARTRNSIAVSSMEYLRNGTKRPHSIISVSSNSSSNSSHSSVGLFGSLNLAFDPVDSPRHLHRQSMMSSGEASLGFVFVCSPLPALFLVALCTHAQAEKQKILVWATRAIEVSMALCTHAQMEKQTVLIQVTWSIQASVLTGLSLWKCEIICLCLMCYLSKLEYRVHYKAKTKESEHSQNKLLLRMHTHVHTCTHTHTHTHSYVHAVSKIA